MRWCRLTQNHSWTIRATPHVWRRLCSARNQSQDLGDPPPFGLPGPSAGCLRLEMGWTSSLAGCIVSVNSLLPWHYTSDLNLAGWRTPRTTIINRHSFFIFGIEDTASAFRSYSVVRENSWQCLGNHMWCWGWNPVGCMQGKHLTHYTISPTLDKHSWILTNATPFFLSFLVSL